MSQNFGHLYPPLKALQALQIAHDRDYSRDIMGMTAENRLTHYALHQGKYVARLVDFDPRDPKFTFNRIVTDSFVVMLATANALQLDLQQAVGDKPPLTFSVKTPQALGFTLLQSQANMASALIEYVPPQKRRRHKIFQARMSEATIGFCRVLGGVAMGLNLDMANLVHERLEKRASGNLFHPQNPVWQRINTPA